MVVGRAGIRLARSGSVTQSRKYWKKHGKKTNARKRRRRKSGAARISYTVGDLMWVKQIVNQHQKTGVSLKDLWKISEEEPKPRHGLRSEKPPGRDKIKQIVMDKDGTDFKIMWSNGGKGKKTVIRPLKPDEIVAIERIGYGISYRTMVERLNSFRKMGDVPNDKPFKIKDFFDYQALKDEMLRFPMKIFLISGHFGTDKMSVFNAVVSEIRKHLRTMKRIEGDQKLLNDEFPTILKHVDALRAENSGELVLMNDTDDIRSVAPQIIPQRNAIRRLARSP